MNKGEKSEVRSEPEARAGRASSAMVTLDFFPAHDEKTLKEFKQRCVIGSGLLLWKYLSDCCMKTH